LCDLSLQMLKIGKQKIETKLNDTLKINFLRTDALKIPFKNNMVDIALSFGIFHIIEEPNTFVAELYRILKNGCKLYLTSLCTDRYISARYLSFLNKKGFVSKPKSSKEIANIIKLAGFNIEKSKVKGGMFYIRDIQ